MTYIDSIDIDYSSSSPIILKNKMSQKAINKKINIDTGISVIYDNWYELEDGYYFFKPYYVFEELLMAELYKRFHVNCVDFKLASPDTNYYGIISKNFRNFDSIYYEADEYSTEHNLETKKLDNGFELLDKEYSKVMRPTNKEIILAELSRILALDYFTGQNDRYGRNLIYEENKHDGQVSLCPLTDNGIIGFNYSQSFIENITLPRSNKIHSSLLSPNELRSIRTIATNREFRYTLFRILDIDIDELMNTVLEKYKIKIATESKDKLSKYLDRKKKIIDNSLTLSRKIR